jgi:hypothetical protein
MRGRGATRGLHAEHYRPLINRHPYFLSLLVVRVPPRPAMMAAKRS